MMMSSAVVKTQNSWVGGPYFRVPPVASCFLTERKIISILNYVVTAQKWRTVQMRPQSYFEVGIEEGIFSIRNHMKRHAHSLAVRFSCLETRQNHLVLLKVGEWKVRGKIHRSFLKTFLNVSKCFLIVKFLIVNCVNGHGC